MANLLKRRAVSLFEILLALVLLASIFIGVTSIVYSTAKHRKQFGLDTLEAISLGMNFVFGEFGKLSITRPSGTTSSGIYNEIGEGGVPSGFVLWRSRVDLDGDGQVNTCDPVFVYLELI